MLWDEMEKSFDPSIPDRSNGGFFCKLCLANANSEHMWSVHIAGKRHIRNARKFPNGLPQRYSDNDSDSFEKPAKYGRYENDQWTDYSSESYGNEYHSQRSYVPEIRPRVIDYGHKKGLSDVISPLVSKTFDEVTMKEKQKDPIEKIFEDEKFDKLKKSFEERISHKQADAVKQNNWSNNKGKPSKEKSSYEDDFEKELDELLKERSDNPGFDKDMFSNDKFKRKIDDLFSGKLGNRELKDKYLEITSTIDGGKDSHRWSKRAKIPDTSISVKQRVDKDKIKRDRNSFKKKSRTNDDDEDFVDIFHKMNDQKLFEMSAADEPEDSSSMKKSKPDGTKLDDFDPDKLSPDVVDNLLTSYMKQKTDSKSEESTKSHTKNSTERNSKEDTKEDDLKILAEKLESLPTKTFLQLILARLKKVDLKDSEDLKIVLDVISQAQEVVCKNLPPRLQAVLKSKMSQNNSKTTSIPVQNSVFPQTFSVPTAFPVVPETVSQPVLPAISQPALKSGPDPLSQEVKSVSQPISHTTHQSVQTPVSDTAPLAKPPFLNSSNSFESMIAWQNYLKSMETASEKPALKSPMSVEATLAYQNFLSNLQDKSQVASKMPSKVTPKTSSESSGSLNSFSKPKAPLSSSLNSSPKTTQANSLSALGKPLNTSKPPLAKGTLQNILSTLEARLSKRASPTQSSSKSSLPGAPDSSQKQPALINNNYVSQINAETVSSTAGISSNAALYQNQAVLQNLNYQTFYQQLYALHLQNISASQSARRQNLEGSQPNSSLQSSGSSGSK